MATLITNEPPMNIARFAGFFIQTVMTGVYWVHFYLYIQSIHQLSKDRHQNLFKTPMFVVGCTLFFIANGEFIVFTISAFIALVNSTTTDAPIPDRGFLSMGPGWNFAYNAFYIAAPVVADGFLIYRLFIVWSRNWWITIIPIGFSLALVVTASMAARYFVASIKTIFDGSRRWMVAAFSLTFASNVYCTSLIALRVILTQRRFQSNDRVVRTNLQRCVEVLIKSAALYCILVGLSFVFSIVESNWLYMSVAATSPVVGICFCMIVTRADSDSKTQSNPGYGTGSQRAAPPTHPGAITTVHPSRDVNVEPSSASTSLGSDGVGTTSTSQSSSPKLEKHAMLIHESKPSLEAAYASSTDITDADTRPISFPEMMQVGLTRRVGPSETVTCLVERVTEISDAS